MRKLSILALATALLFAACNSKKKEATITSDDGKTKVSIDANNIVENASEMAKKAEELKKMTPLSMDQLKAMAPEELMGGKRKNYNASSAMGVGLISADYEMNDTTDVKLSVWDCAGESGAGIYSMQYLGMWNMQSESETEYTKSTDFMGGKAIEHCQKQSNDCTLTFVASGRLLVTLEGRNVGIDALKTAAQGLNLKTP